MSECVVPLIWSKSGEPSSLCPDIVLSTPERKKVLRRLIFTKVKTKFLGAKNVNPATSAIGTKIIRRA